MRKVTVVSTRENVRKEINSDATTWGQLKTEIERQGVSTGDMKAMIRENKNNLENDGASLPSGEFTLFLTPGKVKSGK